jgi:hypothetical protein
MPKKTQSKKTLLASLPSDATRVKVKDEFGATKWREVGAVFDTDELLLKDNAPITMKGKPGRRAATKLEPSTEAAAEVMRQKQIALSKDPISKLADSTPESPDVLHEVMKAMSEEAASIVFERHEAERKGKETSNLSMRRINALKSIGDTWLRRKEQLSGKEIDLDSVVFKALFGFIMDTFKESLSESGLRPEMVDTVFAKLGSKLDEEWSSDARNRMKNAE